MTLSEIKKISSEMLQIEENTARYREQVEQLEHEINQLETEVSETLDFEKDMELQDKKERLPNFKRRLIQAEKKEEEKLLSRGQSLNTHVNRYQREEMAQAEEIEQAYAVAKNALKEAYEAVQTYEQAREDKALSIVETVARAGHDEATAGLGILTYNDTRRILERIPTKLNVSKGIGNGRFQSSEMFFKEVLKAE